MKKIIIFFTFAALLLGLFISPIGTFAKEQIHTSFYPCDAPITYQIDEVDPQFHISKSDFTQKVIEAANIWNSAYGKEILKYTPEGKVGVNLTFDGRQAITENINSLEDNVTSKKGDLQESKAEYERRGAAFETRVKKLNQDVAYWNSQGGAPENEYNRMLEEQNSLKAEANALNEMAKNLNTSTNEFNTNVHELNQSIDTFNSALQKKPEEGVYSEADLRIDIFFNTDTNTLIRTIAHELGHARGLEHVTNESSIMYEKTFPQYMLTPEDVAELSRACHNRTPQEAFTESFRNAVLDIKRKTSAIPQGNNS